MKIALVAVVVWGVAGGLVWRSSRTSHESARPRPGGSDASKSSPTGRPGPARPVEASSKGPRARWVIAENARPGSEGWRLTNFSPDIEGFADRVSAVHGETVNLHVSTSAPSFRVEAYRMGYYGGVGGRLVWRSADTAGTDQGDGVRDTETNMVQAPWSPSLSVRPTRDWPPGVYLFKLIASTGGQRYVPLTLRDDKSTAAYVVQNAVTTWQAYNQWGGYSLYLGRDGSGSSFAKRSRIVSFDRPYDFGDGAADFLGNEYPLVSLVESLGLDVTYWTNVDLHARPELLTRHKALLTLGHDEYWSSPMRQGAEDARDQGVNLAFFGANAIFRQIRFDESPVGPNRRQIGYKSAREDPLYRVDDDLVTVDWRAAPVLRHEAALIGNSYECNPVKADMVIAHSDAWVFEGTGLSNGDRLPDIVGPEYDRFDPDTPAPDSVQILARSPVRCRGEASVSDMTYYTAPSGAGVFATGTNWWISHLVAPCADGFDTCPHDEQAVRITENVLAAFGVGPAGIAHPSEPNWSTIRTPTSARSSTTTTTSSSSRSTTTPTTSRRRSTTTTTSNDSTVSSSTTTTELETPSTTTTTERRRTFPIDP